MSIIYHLRSYFTFWKYVSTFNLSEQFLCLFLAPVFVWILVRCLQNRLQQSSLFPTLWAVLVSGQELGVFRREICSEMTDCPQTECLLRPPAGVRRLQIFPDYREAVLSIPEITGIRSVNQSWCYFAGCLAAASLFTRSWHWVFISGGLSWEGDVSRPSDRGKLSVWARVHSLCITCFTVLCTMLGNTRLLNAGP